MGEALDINDLEPVGDPAGQFKPDLHTPRRDAFTGWVQDSSTYITTDRLSKELGVNYRTALRWAQGWYGPLPPSRSGGGRGMGYRIHPVMRRVARGWLQTQDPHMRDAIRQAVTAKPRDWVVVVGKTAKTYYTAQEALDGAARGITSPRNGLQGTATTILFVGDTRESN